MRYADLILHRFYMQTILYLANAVVVSQPSFTVSTAFSAAVSGTAVGLASEGLCFFLFF
jgi:hypothetical protein